VTDINGCDTSWTFTLNDPPPIVVDTLWADSARCADTETGFVYLDVSGGVPAYNYLWNSGHTTEDLEWIAAGLYVVRIMDDNGCIRIDSVEVFEADRFSVELFVDSDYNGSPISCADSSDAVISLQPEGGTEPYYYEWNNGANSATLDGVPAGYYHVIVRDLYNCTDSAEVTITEPSPVDFNLQYYDPLCYRDSTGRIELLITGGTVTALDDYRVWLNGVLREPFMDGLPQGNYFIRVEDLNNCYDETDVDLVHPDSLELNFETGNAFCKDKPDGQLRLYVDGGTFPYFIEWDRDLPDNEESFNEVYWGQYVATVTDGNNCVTIDTAVVGYTYASCLVIPNAFSPNGDGFNDLWIVEGFELYPNVELRIFDRWGTLVFYTKNAADEAWDGTFTGRQLPIDSYHYIIDLNNGEPPVTGNVTIVR